MTMCGQVRQARAEVRPGMVLTVLHADGTYRQHEWGFISRGQRISNAREEELVETWGNRRERVSIELDGFYERAKDGSWVYFDTPIVAKGIMVGDNVLIVTTNANNIVKRVHSRMPMALT